ncbi:cyclic nucleotide-binding domain-containing protein [Desulfohalovibrio reitneri]|uniref:cyclic nucleotide-binding domain-containing protein n=1 Tax=Desulfohalovibrio reitneri TaxID=1307759 RepID=UPI0004A76577|nr:cyclic nucleotide-binding domain-containing protein [Desulfohalovibrio reitneri]
MKETSYLKGRDELIGQFRKIPSLHNFENRYLKEILSLSKIRKYEPGETIIEEGQSDRWMYVVISGEVRVLKGGEELSRLRMAGDVFGEMGVIDGQPRSATIEAATHTTCLAMDTSFMDHLSEEDRHPFHAMLYKLFSEILAVRLRDTGEELTRCRRELAKLRGETPPE